MKKIKIVFALPLFWLLFKISKGMHKIQVNGQAWCQWQRKNFTLWNMCRLSIGFKEFRNLSYYRIGHLHHPIEWVFPRMANLYTTTPRFDVDSGLIMQYGFATIISAKRVGKNRKIYQQITIGYDHALQAPIIGDNVEICCGAKVIGGVTIDNNVIIGANVAVIKDVPNDCIVAGVPAKTIKKI